MTGFIHTVFEQFRINLTAYPKPYEGIGFVLFSIGAILLLMIPTVLVNLINKSFNKKLFIPSILLWLTISIGSLTIYPSVRGQELLNVFYAYYLTQMIPSFLYLIYKMHKIKFTLSQGFLFLATLASLVELGVIIFFKDWFLVTLCNCIFYCVIILASWLNRYFRRLIP